jgi:hypothetical protein
MENENLEPLANQTQFAVEEAAKETPGTAVSSTAISSPQTPPQGPNKKLVLLIGMAVFLGLVTVLLMLFGKPRQSVTQQLVPTATPVVNTIANPELQQRIDELQADLSKADPSKNDFLFPSVDMTLQLEKDK